jgi:hypothetical protein
VQSALSPPRRGHQIDGMADDGLVVGRQFGDHTELCFPRHVQRAFDLLECGVGAYAIADAPTSASPRHSLSVSAMPFAWEHERGSGR